MLRLPSRLPCHMITMGIKYSMTCHQSLRARSFGVIRVRISDPRSVWSWCIKGTGESTLVMDSLVPLMHHDPDRSWITDLNLDHPKGTHPKLSRQKTRGKTQVLMF